MTFKYEIVAVGGTPTWRGDQAESFHNPIHVGDKVKPAGMRSELQQVVSVEHYTTGSVLYVAPCGQ